MVPGRAYPGPRDVMGCIWLCHVVTDIVHWWHNWVTDHQGCARLTKGLCRNGKGVMGLDEGAERGMGYSVGMSSGRSVNRGPRNSEDGGKLAAL
jgi:hypothetical protein